MLVVGAANPLYRVMDKAGLKSHMTLKNKSTIKKYALINGVRFDLPPEAGYYMQSPNGAWSYTVHEPVYVYKEKCKATQPPVDWTYVKRPIQVKTPEGWDRALVTPVHGDWKETLTSSYEARL